MSNTFAGFGNDEESDAGDFNPAAETLSDDETPQSRNRKGNDDVDDGEEEDDIKPRKSASRAVLDSDEEDTKDKEKVQSRPAKRESEDGDREPDDEDDEGPGESLGDGADDDEDEEDEEEEDDDAGPQRKKRRRERRNQFLDVEAEVDDEDEDIDDEEDEARDEGFVADTHPDDEGLDARAEADDRRHRELDIQRQREVDLDAEAEAERFRKKYGRNQAAAVNTAITPQRLMLPSVDDPAIWGVKCKPGKEREVVFAIMKRVSDRMDTREPMEIFSAFERGGTMSGYVYVEARTKTQVEKALENLPNCYSRGPNAMILVDIGERPDLLRVQKSKALEPGMYVRIKRGKYQGDLAQVEEVEMNGLNVELRLVPRLDYGLNEDASAPIASAAEAAKRKRANAFGRTSAAGRPPQRMFSDVEARKKHGRYLQQQSSYNNKAFNYFGENYVNGFLIKQFKVQHLQIEDVNPTLEEVTKFTAGAEDGAENLDLNALAATLKAGNAAASYLPGDVVEVYQGEQQGVKGKAVSVRGDIVELRVTEGALTGQTLEAPVKTLRKLFREGDHVKVVGGSKYQDEVGMVIKIKDDRVSLLTDANNQEITVFSKDLRAATDSAITTATSKYDLHDLVQLDPATVGCVIKVDRESLRVLDQNGDVRTLLPSNISNKLERRRFAVATDKDGTEIRNDDTVKEAFGEQRKGRILHIHRSFLFLHNREQREDAGIFVVRNSAVVTVATGQTRANAGPDLTKLNPAATGGRNGAAGSMPPPKPAFGRDRLLGKTCKVRRGAYKGLLGIVKDTTETEARVELHTKNKVITVPKDVLTVIDSTTGQSLDMSRFGGPRSNGMGGATPHAPSWDGGRTPAMNGGQTPGWGVGGGGRTPGWGATAAAGGRTPGWGAGGGGRTPGWSMGNSASGGKTPGWKQSLSSRTPAPGRNDGSRTAYGGATSYGGSTTYGGGTTWNPDSNDSGGFGGRTPAAGAFGQTPAYGGSTAQTPGGFAADTPAGNPYGAYGGTYATPAAAATPGGFAQTPGASGGGDEGYED